MKAKTITFERKGSIGIITLNRPEKKNAINTQMVSELREIRSGIGWDSEITVILLNAEGSDFSVGTDPNSYRLFEKREDLINSLAMAPIIASFNQPTIAVIQGNALGQGLELALACDMKIASDISHFSMAQIIIGELPFDGGTQRLPRLIGRLKALEMILTGLMLDSEAAMKIGLVNRIVPADELMPTALKLAEDLSAKGPIALRYAKEAVMKGLDMTLEQGLRLEADLYFLLHTTKDRGEGITSFRQKRDPEFKGK